MTRDRLVFETSAARKEAFDKKLEAAGLTASEWLEEQLELSLGADEPRTPTYNEIEDTAKLRDLDQVRERLSAIDWAFTEAHTQYLSHDLHPYPAKFIPQIPGYLTANLSTRGEVVFDPFGGSGTTALEALRLGRRALSVDANPLCRTIGKVKTARLTTQGAAEIRGLRGAVETRLDDLPDSPDQLINEFESYIPSIPNIDKWFPLTSRGEMAFISSKIDQLEAESAREIARLALSRVVLGASHQDSETRYASKPEEIPFGLTLKRFLENLNLVVRRVAKTESSIQYGVAKFVTADTRDLAESSEQFPDDSVDLVVTSPPYGNANDYHLYHRFRLFWLGHDPRDLGKIEIGSHLRHQRENSGFESFIDDLSPCLRGVKRMLKPGRFAAFVVGHSVYDGETYSTAEALAETAAETGFEVVETITRDLPETKRSFSSAARRAKDEQIVILRNPPNSYHICFNAPAYTLWEYEKKLRTREVESLLNQNPEEGEDGELCVDADPYVASNARRLTFSAATKFADGHTEPTWQKILENGFGAEQSRKDPKYVTHGIHSYKGKFYPQLVKSLFNVAGVSSGDVILDPFCGSGTAVLEAKLNGLRGYGCDLHPLAAKIGRAKVGILDVDPRIVQDAVKAVDRKLPNESGDIPEAYDQFTDDSIEEIESWFPEPVVYKLNAILRAIRGASAGVVQEYLEVILSSIVRDVSQQDPSDLRIRRRKEPLEDAPAIDLFRKACHTQLEYLEAYWEVKGHCPHKTFPAAVAEGDARDEKIFEELGLEENSADLILTSPPYATALPYIDTDRLSLLVLSGITSSDRRPLERDLTGSREILKSTRKELDRQIEALPDQDFPDLITEFVTSLYQAVLEHDVGFRRRNKPALLLRFCQDMKKVLSQCARLLQKDGEAVIILGDNSTTVGDKQWEIPTRKMVRTLGEQLGLQTSEEIDISVTTEDMKHIRHAITDNTVIRMYK